MPAYTLKPKTPRKVPGKMPAGCKLFYALEDYGNGKKIVDYSGYGNDAFYVGTAPWQRGFYGPQLGGFTNSNYALCNPQSQFLLASYPSWIACLFTNTSSSTSIFVPFGAASNTNGNPFCTFFVNISNVTNQVAYRAKNTAGTQANATSSGALPRLNSGDPQFLMGISYHPSLHVLIHNGGQVASNATTVALPSAIDTITIGAIKTNGTTVDAWPGGLIYCLAGSEQVPDPRRVYEDLLSGKVEAIRPRTRRRVVYFGGTIYTISGTGGLILAGSGSSGQGQFAGVSGGLILGGSATRTAAYVVPGSGSLVSGGAGDISAGYATLGASGFVLGGSAPPSAVYGHLGSGSLVAGGVGLVAQSFVPGVTGGVVLAGAGGYLHASVGAVAGGVVLGGTTSPGSGFAMEGSGGVVLGGHAATGIEPPVGGSVVLAGAGLVVQDQVYEGTGSLVLDGVASAVKLSAAVGQGGITLGGVAFATLGTPGSGFRRTLNARSGTRGIF